MKRTIDCYGHPNTDSERFRKIEEPVDEVKEDASGNVFLRFGTGQNCAIHKIDATGGVSRRWTYGAWSNREELNYTAGMQDTLSVDMED